MGFRCTQNPSVRTKGTGSSPVSFQVERMVEESQTTGVIREHHANLSPLWEHLSPRIFHPRKRSKCTGLCALRRGQQPRQQGRGPGVVRTEHVQRTIFSGGAPVQHLPLPAVSVGAVGFNPLRCGAMGSVLPDSLDFANPCFPDPLHLPRWSIFGRYGSTHTVVRSTKRALKRHHVLAWIFNTSPSPNS